MSDRPSLDVALVQTEVEDGAAEANVERVLHLLDGVGDADLVLLPELWTTGYAHASWRAVAENVTPGVVQRLSSLASAREQWIAGSMVSLEPGGGLVNRLWLNGPRGEVVHYDKGHLFAPMGETDRMVPGSTRGSADIRGWRTAPSICFDLRFPEMYRLDALGGAELFLVVSAWPSQRAEIFDVLCRARAIENQAFLVACNRAGIGADGTRFAGRSVAVAPDGTILGRLGADGEEHLAVRLEADRLVEIRSSSHLALRRPGLDWSNSQANEPESSLDGERGPEAE